MGVFYLVLSHEADDATCWYLIMPVLLPFLKATC